MREFCLDEIRAGKSKYQFIEVMGCPGGCIAGGGQPYVKPCFLPDEDIDILDTYKEKRANALYSEDERTDCQDSPTTTRRLRLKKYKKSNGLKDKQNDSKQQFLCFSIK